MDKRSFEPLWDQAQLGFGPRRNGVRMRGQSVMSDLTTRSYEFESFKSPTEGNPMRRGLRYSYDSRLVTPAPPAPLSALPPLGFAISSRGPITQAASDFDGYNFWKQYQKGNTRRSFFMPEPGADQPAKTTFEMMYTPRDIPPHAIHSMKNPKPLPVARQIVPDDPKSADERLLPSVDRDKMTRLPSKFGKSKKHLEAQRKPAGIFYSYGDVEDSKDDQRYWGSLSSLWGNEFSRKRDLQPTQPTAMTVNYFNGGAPGSPKRKNRRTSMPLKRSDSSRVDFNNSEYERIKHENYM